MPISATKQKLPKGFAYPLKTSMLEEELLKQGIDIDIELTFSHQDTYVFDSTFWLEGQHSKTKRVTIYSGSVELANRKDAATKMKEEIVPDFGAWLKELFTLPENSPILFGKHDRLFFRRK